jgi:hypothetical protein
VPTRLQPDNQQGLAEAGNEPGAVGRLCLAHGVTPVFIPDAEPWRNGAVEHTGDTVDQRFLRCERFATPDRVAARYGEVTAFHNAWHRYSALGGLTPDQAEARADFTPTPPVPDQPVPERLADLTRHVEHIRLIRCRRHAARHGPPLPPCPTTLSTTTSWPASTSPPSNCRSTTTVSRSPPSPIR